MMTGELVTTETFQEIPVRVISTPKRDRVIPLNDIAKGIGYDKAGLRKIVVRNEKQFAPYICKVVTTSQSVHGDQAREYLCLTRDGIVGLLMRLDIERIQDPSKQTRVLEFQRWAIETLGKVMDGHFADVSKIGFPITSILDEKLQVASILSERTGVKPGIAYACAIAEAEKEAGKDLTWCKNLLPPAENPPGFLIPTEIGLQLGITARQVNMLLETLKYQFRAEDGWHLTDAGRLLGEEYPYHRNGHSGYQIKWRYGVLQKIETVFHQTRQGQTGLYTWEGRT